MNLDTANVATIITCLLALVGAIVVITNPDTLTFDQYLDQMKVLIGGLAVGRGLAAYSRRRPVADPDPEVYHRP